MASKIISIVLACFLPFLLRSQYQKLHDFTGMPDGNNPSGELYFDGIHLYGMTEAGGINGTGSIYKIDAEGNGYSVLFSFDGLNGFHAIGSLVSDGEFLYGVTYAGGPASEGTLFKIKTDGTGFSTLKFFSNTLNGFEPRGKLVFDGTYLYGIAAGGTFGYGVIYKIKTDGSAYSVLKSFNGYTDGEYPSSLVFDGQYLYGVTSSGGANGSGTIFKITPDGSSFVKLRDFSNMPDGDNALGSLVISGITLYGTTRLGGQSGNGTIFKINTDGSGYAKLYDFDGTANGAYPFTGLCSGGTVLYGTTGGGGTNQCGTLFRINTDGTGYSKLFGFDRVASGATPFGALTNTGSRLYGTTNSGGQSAQSGANGAGVIFAFNDLLLSQPEIEAQFKIEISPNPTDGHFKVSMPEGQRCLVDVYDVSGQLILRVKQQSLINTLDISNFPAGLYQIHVLADNGSSAKGKIIKQ